MEFSIARQRLYQELRQPDAHIDLAAAALYIAQEEYPDLDTEEYLHALDMMAAEVQERLPAEQYPLRVLKTINQYLFDDLGFSGNALDYYDPRNSFLNEVIDRRTGIPITLSLIYLEIAKRIDFPMAGVGMPGHFLVRPLQDDMTVFVDAFHQGEILFPEDCQTCLQQLYSSSTVFKPEFLEPIDSHHFLARLLTNLKMIYLRQGDLEKTLSMVERLLLIFPTAVMERRDRGILYYHVGRWTEAKRDFELYLEEAPTAQDAVMIQQLLEQMEES